MGLHSAGLREAMEAGWRALEHVPNASGEDGVAEWRHYQAAQLEFDQALQIDDQFAEAAQWRSFAQAMEQGLRDASQRQYGSAGQSFAEAARALEASAGEPRPAVLGGTKSQQDRRQQATTIAAGLAATAQELGQLVQTYTTRESEPDPNPTEMQRLIRDIRSREQWFKDLSQRSVVPPSDMSKRRSLDTVSQNKTGEIAKETIEPAD